ncbi:lipopolysaccharide biosynthesis protein [Blautia sp. HCP3S3_H10_1]|uniref:lipopolysaccharide biosynthesis protein n=1 Tax=unclassified Blautia TaxID=2648079 RepID=UPI003F914D0B
MNNITKHWKDNLFIKNIMMVVGGTAFAQIITILITPILSRIYSPQEYGIYGTFSSLIAIFSISISLDYQNAIPLEKDDENASILLKIAIAILGFATIMLYVLLVFWGDNILGIFNSSELSSYIVFIVAGVFFTGLYNIFLQNAFRKSAFKDISFTKYSQSIIGNLVKIVLGLFAHNPVGLLIGTIIGQSAGIIRLFKVSLKDYKNVRKIERYKKLLIKYKKFPLFSAPNNLVNTFAIQLPILMLASLYDQEVVGNFSFANSIVGLPTTFVGTAIGQVFYAKIAKYGSDDLKKMKSDAKKMTLRMSEIGIIGYGLLAIIAPELCCFVFGKQWQVAGEYIRYMCINALMSFIILPIGRILEIVNQQQIGLIFNIIRLIILFVFFFMAQILKITDVCTIIGYSILSSILYGILIMMIFGEINKKIKANL